MNIDVDFPYELTKEQWGAARGNAREQMRGNNVQVRCTKSAHSGMISAAKMLDWLDFGVRKDLEEQLKQVQSGEKVLTGFAKARFIYRLEHPTTYRDVIKKAKRLGLVHS
ncbi:MULTISPECIES: hypothetical protein [Pseudoalteromonas]|uniref:hypothetical protein n=1 Tax=Pseudoalteromonas TaxID=53246 RepID=UPI0015815449|nr:MULTISPECIES: hypothetical protein [Pseudoalteromonas]MDI4654229.1 hypothetical protein [Pseudoalteromonas shioyasakiensis]NUJ40183.1 hypothetical protein [Pseudoalteromonas sp. 0303]